MGCWGTSKMPSSLLFETSEFCEGADNVDSVSILEDVVASSTVETSIIISSLTFVGVDKHADVGDSEPGGVDNVSSVVVVVS